MILPTFVLDPTEEEKQSLLDAELKYIALDSDNPKDASLVGACQESNSKALMFIVEKENMTCGNAFGFGASGEDFMANFPTVEILLEYWEKVKEIEPNAVVKEPKKWWLISDEDVRAIKGGLTGDLLHTLESGLHITDAIPTDYHSSTGSANE